MDLDLLIKDKLLKASEVKNRDWGDREDRVDYGKIYENRFAVLRLAYERGAERSPLSARRTAGGWKTTPCSWPSRPPRA